MLDRTSTSITFADISSPPTPSLLRGFSAPVKLQIDLDEDDLLRLFEHDSDPFNRWQAAQTCAMRLLTSAVDDVKAQRDTGLQAALRGGAVGPSRFDRAITPSRRRSWRCRANPTWPANSGRTSTRMRYWLPGGRSARLSVAGSGAGSARSTIAFSRVRPTVPTRQAPAGAHFATPCSTSSPPATRMTARRSPQRNSPTQTT